MKKNTMKIRLILSMLIAIIIAGCGTTSSITHSWTKENPESIRYKKILVLGLLNDNDQQLREKMETHIVEDLRALGYEAVCSCNEYNPNAFKNMTEEEAIKKLKTSGVDAVLSIVLLDKIREKYYKPARIQYSPYYYYQSRFWNYSRLMFERIYEEDYYTTTTKYIWESNLYNLATNDLIYSAQSQSFDPNSKEKLGHEYGQMIIKDMLKRKVLTEKTKGELKAM
ncbi:MAG: hypothetical protein IPH34_11070 [Chitinophagaceae bacterium]|nr:hypothetical protein [Chitinophagaceae bacterium]MBK8310301.1 hypothetical protein [Chitinophagaceae bacterium]MBK8606884.1 hypothetical protein [Chitinophagaceae bacterium]HQV55982.1 hypothetical protein [Chitinophagaceae bacterium]HQX97190.1 hypothetical protein [Chitinophagaceae bacterium]